MEICRSKLAAIDLGLGLCTNDGARSPSSEAADSPPLPQKTYNLEDRHCDATECAEKVEAMLSTAIMQQEDVWNMLMISVSEGLSCNSDTSDGPAVAKISPEYFFAMKGKLENSIDWCSLAQTRLRGINSYDTRRLMPLSGHLHKIVHEKELM